MRTISRYIIIILLLVFSILCKAAPGSPASWVIQTISEIPSVKVSTDTLNNFNFSSILQDDRLLYDDIGRDSDDYSNNQFLGTWTSFRTNANKRCAWGQYRIPHSGDLDIGAAEFSVNPKYINNGWGD